MIAWWEALDIVSHGSLPPAAPTLTRGGKRYLCGIGDFGERRSCHTGFSTMLKREQLTI